MYVREREKERQERHTTNRDTTNKDMRRHDDGLISRRNCSRGVKEEASSRDLMISEQHTKNEKVLT